MKKKLTPAKRRMLLRIANRVRAKMGKKPIKRLLRGEPGEPNHCVLANTIGYGVNVDYSPAQKTLTFALSGDPDDADAENLVFKNAAVADILADFDNGLYPELVKR